MLKASQLHEAKELVERYHSLGRLLEATQHYRTEFGRSMAGAVMVTCPRKNTYLRIDAKDNPALLVAIAEAIAGSRLLILGRLREIGCEIDPPTPEADAQAA